MCDNYCVSPRWNSQHWLVDSQYNFSRFWCFLHFCVTYFQVSCCSPTMGGFFQSRKQWLEHQYHSQHWKTYPKKNNLGSEGMQLVGNMLMRPTRGEPVGPVAKGEKGRGGHWAAFGTRLRLSCLWPPLRWPPDIFKGIHSLRGRPCQLGSAGLLQRRHQWACRAPPAAGHPPCWWATHPHPGRSVVGLQRPPLPAGTAPVAGQPPSQVEVKTTPKKWRETSITLLSWNHLKISKIKLTLIYWMWFNPQFCCQPQQ